MKAAIIGGFRGRLVSYTSRGGACIEPSPGVIVELESDRVKYPSGRPKIGTQVYVTMSKGNAVGPKGGRPTTEYVISKVSC